jgi:hypothetical protein
MISDNSCLTMADVDTHDYDYFCTEKEEYINDIFEDICQDAEAEDEMEQCRNRAARRSSMSGIDNSYRDHRIGDKEDVRRRRHSTFNPRNRKSHRNAREEVKEHLLCVQDESHIQRRISVNNLMDFNVSLEVAMVAPDQDLSPALNISCPVLSYLSVNEDLLDDKVMKTKRPSLLSVSGFDASEKLEAERSVEAESKESNVSNLKSEYTVELPYTEESDNVSTKGKPRKRHSYKLLERRLSLESPKTVIKALRLCEKNVSNQLSVCTDKAQSPKTNDNYVSDAVQGPTVQQLPDKRQYACGA